MLSVRLKSPDLLDWIFSCGPNHTVEFFDFFHLNVSVGAKGDLSFCLFLFTFLMSMGMYYSSIVAERQGSALVTNRKHF